MARAINLVRFHQMKGMCGPSGALRIVMYSKNMRRPPEEDEGDLAYRLKYRGTEGGNHENL